MQRFRVSLSRVTRLSVDGSKVCKSDAWGCSGDRRFSSGISETMTSSEAGISKAPSRLVRRGGALALFVAMGLVGYNAFDDLVIYDRCSSKAMETASQDPRLKEALGEEIQRGPWHWYEASLAVAPRGHSASCSFPVSGSQGSASLHLKAVKLHGKTASLLPRMLDGGEWEVLMLEARVPASADEHSNSRHQRINLMQTSDELKAGDGIGGEAGQCISAALQEV